MSDYPPAGRGRNGGGAGQSQLDVSNRPVGLTLSLVAKDVEVGQKGMISTATERQTRRELRLA